MHDFSPKFLGLDSFLHPRLLAVHGEFLHIFLSLDGSLHELVVYPDGHIGAGHLSLSHLGVDERLAVGVLDADGEHERSPPSILRHLACGVAVPFHEWNKSRAGESGVIHRCSFRPDVGEVVPHSATPFHELHLLLVDAHDGSIGVGIPIETYHEAVGKRGHLMVVANSRHGTSRRHDILEMVEHVEDGLHVHGIGIFVLYACNFPCYSPVHVFRRLLVYVSVTVFDGIFVDPHTCCQFISVEIVERGLICLFIRIGNRLIHGIRFDFLGCKSTKSM